MKFNWQEKKITLHGISDADWIYSVIKKSGTFYEIDLLKYIRYATENRRGCILDIGANIGNHSVFFGLFVSEVVICFEPNPVVLPVLEMNLSENQINHKLYRLGLGEKEETLSVELPYSDIPNVGAAKLVENKKQGGELVHVVTLDSLLPEIKLFLKGLSVLAIKMDVEGMEPAVLRGGKLLLEEYKPDLYIEVLNPDQMKKIQTILTPMGYKKIVSWASTPVWHFVHIERLSVSRQFRLFPYILIQKLIAYLSLVIYQIRKVFSWLNL